MMKVAAPTTSCSSAAAAANRRRYSRPFEEWEIEHIWQLEQAVAAAMATKDTDIASTYKNQRFDRPCRRCTAANGTIEPFGVWPAQWLCDPCAHKEPCAWFQCKNTRDLAATSIDCASCRKTHSNDHQNL